MNMKSKKTFIKDDEIYIGLFEDEIERGIKFTLNDDFIVYSFDKEYIKSNYELLNWEWKGKNYFKYEVKIKDLIENEFKELEDDNISSLTIRDLYSILQNVPCSNKPWLNQLINGASNKINFGR